MKKMSLSWRKLSQEVILIVLDSSLLPSYYPLFPFILKSFNYLHLSLFYSPSEVKKILLSNNTAFIKKKLVTSTADKFSCRTKWWNFFSVAIDPDFGRDYCNSNTSVMYSKNNCFANLFPFYPCGLKNNSKIIFKVSYILAHLNNSKKSYVVYVIS